MMQFGILTLVVLGTVLGQGDKNCGVARDLGSGSGCDSPAPGRQFYFDKARGVCQPFQFRGCGGNGNRFATAQECRDFCVNGQGAQQLESQREENPLIQACQAQYATDHLTARTCNSAADCPSEQNYDCTRGHCCAKKAFVCNLDYDAGKFAVSGPGKSDRYFWSTQYRVCMRFSFYGSLGNENNFDTYNACQKMCAH